MKQKQIIAVVSAYRVMTENDNRYEVLIHAGDEEEFIAKFKTFMLGETVWVRSNPEITGKLGPIVRKKVYEATGRLRFPEEEGERVVMEVSELCTNVLWLCISRWTSPNMVLTLNNRTTMENKADYIYNSQLEGMNVSDLSDLLARASSILRKKLLEEPDSLYGEDSNEESRCTKTDETSIIQNEESESGVLTENNDNEEITASVEVHEKSDEKVSSETTEDNEEESDEYSDVKILPSILYNEKSEPTEEFEGKFLGLMDVNGRPSKEFSQVGATVGGKKAERLKKLAEEEGLEAAIEKMRDHDSQWERVYSPNGICPTIAKSVPPLILVSNEVDTCNEPMVIEIEIPKRTLKPLW